MSNALRDVLEQHAHDVDDAAAGDRLARVHGRVATVRRRRRAGGSVLAAVVVAAIAVGLTVFTGDQRDQRPDPAKPSMEGYAPQGEYAASPQGVPVAKAYVDVPVTHFRLVFSCPLTDNGRATLRIQPEQKGTGAPPETLWEGPCSSEPTTLDLDGPGLELPSGATYPPNTFASITMNHSSSITGIGLAFERVFLRCSSGVKPVASSALARAPRSSSSSISGSLPPRTA